MADNLLAFNDDAESRDTVNSAIEHFEIPVDLTLILEVGTYEDSNAGAYTLSVLPGEPLPLPEPTPVEVVAGTPPAEVQTPAADAPAGSATERYAAESQPAADQATLTPSPDPDATPAPTPTLRTAVAGPEVPSAEAADSEASDVEAAAAVSDQVTGTTTIPLPTPTATPAPPRPTRATVRTQGARLSVRSGPGTDFARAGWVANGATLPILDVSPDGAWILVAVEGLDEGDSGWIAIDYVELK
ncbi:MAG: SH3 domain-containing protein, partial [Caldilineaceae bacterium]|nr:SH3 domain-containing protein [Caldilineaceae bacterium]